MPARIEDYGVIGDLQTAALIDRQGSVDWLCFPRFDSGACFAALLGDERNGRWLLCPVGRPDPVKRSYREGTLVLETEYETKDGAVRVLDFMPPRGDAPDIVRIVEGLRGRVLMQTELVIRFDYGWIVPWVRRIDGTRIAIAGPDALCLRTGVELRGENMTTVADFTVGEGERIAFTLTWFPSNEPAPPEVDPEQALVDTETYWREWTQRCTYEGPWQEAVQSSLRVLKALTYSPTGGIVAAATTSLPERLGGVRNWDYRFCWLRDATFTLYAMLTAGYTEEARKWRDWLLRAVAGSPSDIQIMYGVAGERRLTELELSWLSGYEGSKPVRTGNAASRQFQLDVYGEVMDSLHQARRHGLGGLTRGSSWALQKKLLDFLESNWQEPDEGIWEVRGPRQQFTHSKVMAWVAFDRAVSAVECFDRDGPVDRWKQIRAEIHEEVCREGFDTRLNAFVQVYGSKSLDASLLMIPLVGFLPPADPRVVGTVDAIQNHLTRDGFVERYHTEDPSGADPLPGGEGVFLPCTFWLADNLALIGRHEQAVELFERLLDVRSELGLLAEEYDPATGRQLGNFPQAFTHVGLVNTAFNLARTETGPADHRRSPEPIPESEQAG